MTRGKLRAFGAIILFFNLWVIGTYKLPDIAVVLMTVGFVIAYEWIVVRGLAPKDDAPK